MARIALTGQSRPETTNIPNHFIDRYMPMANGAFVKVYLYLLRHLQHKGDLAVDLMAEELDETEKDILRALAYWEKLKLIHIKKNAERVITDISVLDLSQEDSSSTIGIDGRAGLLPKNMIQITKQGAVAESDAAMQGYTPEQISELVETEEIKWLLATIEKYLERLLKPSDIQFIIYLYDGLAFSSALILYLYEYCISNNKKSQHYIKAVAFSWAKDGIDTVEKAENTVDTYNAGYQVVCKAFGIDRKLGSTEKQYVTKWFKTYGLDAHIIEEALNRTLLTRGKPDFKYANGILSAWHKKGVKSTSDIKELDDEHVQMTRNKPKAATTMDGNKFNAFGQREHTPEYYLNLEKHLLQNKG